jgi:hypothetical protein
LGNAAVQRLVLHQKSGGNVQRLFGFGKKKAPTTTTPTPTPLQGEEMWAALFKERALWNIFVRFAMSEHSHENTDFYEQVKSFEKSPSQELAQNIYDLWVAAGSEHEINVVQKQRDAVKQKLDKRQIDQNLFSDLKTATEFNMSDTLSRFKVKDEYLNLFYQALTAAGYQWQQFIDFFPLDYKPPQKPATPTTWDKIKGFFGGKKKNNNSNNP